jgi:hypothetical protein
VSSALGSALDSGFVQAIVEGVVAGLVVIFVGYVMLDRRLNLKATRDRRRAFDDAVIDNLLTELRDNQEKSELLLTTIPHDALPYPAYQVTWLGLIREPAVLTELKPSTVTALLPTYNRLVSANEIYDDLRSMRHGLIGIMALVSTHESMPAEFLTQRQNTADRLLDRVRELAPHLAAAIAALALEKEARHPPT